MKRMQSVPFNVVGNKQQDFNLPINAKNIRLIKNFATTELFFEINLEDLKSEKTEVWTAFWSPDTHEVPDDAIALHIEIYQGGSFTKEVEVLWFIQKKKI